MRFDADEMAREWKQIDNFIQESMNRPQFYITSGQLEPVHLRKEQSDLLIKGMKETMLHCISEIEMWQQSYREKTLRSSDVLKAHNDSIQHLYDTFMSRVEEKPWIFQKCSLRSLVMAKECLNMVRQDANTLCQQEILKYLESLSTELGAFKD